MQNINQKENTPYEVTPEGSLGILALGYRGLLAWRSAKAAAVKANLDKNNNSKNSTSKKSDSKK